MTTKTTSRVPVTQGTVAPREGPERPPPGLGRADRERLRDLAELSRLLVRALLARGHVDELTGIGIEVADRVLTWHRQIEPHRYGRRAGGRP